MFAVFSFSILASKWRRCMDLRLGVQSNLFTMSKLIESNQKWKNIKQIKIEKQLKNVWWNIYFVKPLKLKMCSKIENWSAWEMWWCSSTYKFKISICDILKNFKSCANIINLKSKLYSKFHFIFGIIIQKMSWLSLTEKHVQTCG